MEEANEQNRQKFELLLTRLEGKVLTSGGSVQMFCKSGAYTALSITGKKRSRTIYKNLRTSKLSESHECQ